MKDTKEQLIREEKFLKVQKIRKSTKLREKGITLIALVVTIIILLILTGVTLNMALSDNGLFKKAREAVEKYEKAQEDEEETIRQISTQMYSEYVGAKVTGYEPIAKTAEKPCTITAAQSGYTENQTFTTDVAKTEETSETGMQWRVWDFDGNILRIVGDPTSQKLVLKGVAGYNNGVWAIEEICKECYSNGKEGVEVTSLKRSDIQNVSSYDYTKYKHTEKNGDEVIDENNDTNDNFIHFGEFKTYGMYNNFPQMWGNNDKEWSYEYNNETKLVSGEDKECKKWEGIGENGGYI